MRDRREPQIISGIKIHPVPDADRILLADFFRLSKRVKRRKIQGFLYKCTNFQVGLIEILLYIFSRYWGRAFQGGGYCIRKEDMDGISFKTLF